MSKFLYGSICLSDIPQNQITVSQTNGKKYLNVTISERKEKGKFGETHSIAVSIPKEQRNPNEKPFYIGNLKEWEGKQNQQGNVPHAGDDLGF